MFLKLSLAFMANKASFINKNEWLYKNFQFYLYLQLFLSFSGFNKYIKNTTETFFFQKVFNQSFQLNFHGIISIIPHIKQKIALYIGYTLSMLIITLYSYQLCSCLLLVFFFLNVKVMSIINWLNDNLLSQCSFVIVTLHWYKTFYRY